MDKQRREEQRREEQRQKQRQYRKAQRIAAKERLQASGQLDAIKARQKELRRQAYLQAKERVTAEKTAQKTAQRAAVRRSNRETPSANETSNRRQLEELSQLLEKLGPSALRTFDEDTAALSNRSESSPDEDLASQSKERPKLRLVWQRSEEEKNN